MRFREYEPERGEVHEPEATETREQQNFTRFSAILKEQFAEYWTPLTDEEGNEIQAFGLVDLPRPALAELEEAIYTSFFVAETKNMTATYKGAPREVLDRRPQDAFGSLYDAIRPKGFNGRRKVTKVVIMNGDEGHVGEEGQLGKIKLSVFVEQHCKKGTTTHVGVTEVAYSGYHRTGCVTDARDIIRRQFTVIEPMAQLETQLSIERAASKLGANRRNRDGIAHPYFNGIEQSKRYH